jgi:CD109 antigen
VALTAFAATNVNAEDAAMLVAPAELHAGGSSSLTVTTFDLETREPIAREVTVELRSGDDVVAELFRGRTTDGGRVHVSFDVPELAAGSYAIEARVDGAGSPLRIETSVSNTPAILIETDKPIYKPSQKIQGRVLLVDNRLRPRAGEVELAIHDGKGIRVDRQQLVANEYGVAAFSLDLAREVNFGTWKIRVKSDRVESVRDIRVEEYTLPRFDLGVSFARPWALVDEVVAGTVNARYFFGRDVEGDVVLTASRFVGDWQEYARIEGTLTDGEMQFELPPVDFVAGTPQDGGQGSVTVEVEVIDTTGHSQTMTEVLTISQASLVLGIVSLGSTLKAEIPFDLLITASTPQGDPLDATANFEIVFFNQFVGLIERVRREVTITGGASEITVVPPADTAFAEVLVTAERDGRRTSTALSLGAAYSQSGGFLSLFRQDGEGPASPGSNVTYGTVTTHPGTVYYEVYAGGRTVLSEFSETGEFSFSVTPEMAPKARIVAYVVFPNNEVAADSVLLEVDPSAAITIDASFDRETSAPGESIQVTVDAGTGERTLIGLSIVDQSVLALGRSRLHLQEVFEEIERRFLEPQVVEVPGGGAPGGEGPRGGPVGPPPMTGALDVFEDAGLRIATTENINVSEGDDLFWQRDFDDDVAEAGPGPGDDEGVSTPQDGVRVRQYFPETWVWEPLLITDENGIAVIDLTVPDSITGWKLSAIGSSSAGIGFGESELTAFQDFFVEPSLPYDVTRGEEFPVKVDVFNYLEVPQSVSIAFGDGEWFDLLGAADATLEVPANSATSVEFPIRPTMIGEHTIEVTAIGSKLADAVRRTIRVVPEGLPRELVENDVVEAGDTRRLTLEFPSETVAGSARAYLNVTPSPVAQTMNGISDLLQMPYGCGEQNMIFLAPDIEILKYLREVGELNPEIRVLAEFYVNTGYQRELTFQTDDGGFAAFGGANGSLWLTAFVLSTFSGAREVRDIDEGMLARAAGMLVSRQRDDGSYQTDSFLIHQEMDGGLENVFAMAAYVTNALADYADGADVGNVVEQSIGRAAGFLRDRRGDVENDPYSLAIAAVALLKVPGFEADAESIIDRLLELAIDEGVGLHWEPYPVETTGYVAMALIASGRPQAGGAVDWLSTQRNSLGGYGGSTQDTVVAIRALFLAARTVQRDLDIDFEVVSGDDVLWTLHLDAGNFDVLHTFELPLVGEGIEFRTSGTGATGYQVVRRFNLPGILIPPARDILIEVEYDSEGIEVDEIVDVVVRLRYTGAKESTAMVIADVGVPTGFSVVRSTLDALVEAGTVSRADVAGRKAILYLDSLVRDETVEFSFQIRARYPVRAEGPVSRVYEYYDREIQAYHTAPAVTVRAGVEPDPLFVRGDSNRDLEVNLSDAVAALEFLFQGGQNMRCSDAADVNDDGQLDITDSIQLLNFLFRGGPSPAPPYPERGTDETEDFLSCEGAL